MGVVILELNGAFAWMDGMFKARRREEMRFTIYRRVDVECGLVEARFPSPSAESEAQSIYMHTINFFCCHTFHARSCNASACFSKLLVQLFLNRNSNAKPFERWCPITRMEIVKRTQLDGQRIN